jgi:arylsulfatase A-like enzyme
MEKERKAKISHFFFVAFAIIPAIIAGILSYSPDKKPKRNPVILISIDTLRPDHLGTYGYTRPTSPNIDRLASDAAVFENAYSHSPNTIVSHATMLTSLHPIVHSVTPEYKMAPTLDTIAEYYHTAGFKTGGFTTHKDWLCEKMGFAQGFDTFYSEYVNARTLNEQVFQYLEENAGVEFFLFLHYYDPHSDFTDLPYNTRTTFDTTFCQDYQGDFSGCEAGVCASEYLKQLNKTGTPLLNQDLQYIIDLYDGGVLYTDHHIGELLNKLKELEIYEDALIVITADHGEEFREHGHFLHDQLYDETMHVPLIMKFPNSLSKGHFPQMSGVIDIMPTMLEFSKIPHKGLQGTSLLPIIKGSKAEGHPVFSTLKETGTYKSDYISVRNRAHSLITWERFSNSYLFNLKTDPQETADLSSQNTQIADHMLNLAKKYYQINFKTRNRLKHKHTKVQQSDEAAKRLKSLGYLN